MLSERRTLVDMPIRLIAIPKVWSPGRYDDNTALIQERKSVPPIDLSWHGVIRRFVILDGIHRSNAARDLGYPSIPARIYPGELKQAARDLGSSPWLSLGRVSEYW